MKKLLFITLLFSFHFCLSQNGDPRIETIKNRLEVLAVDNVGLTEQVKTEISVSNITLSNFLLAVSNVHKVNMNLAPELGQISIVNNFSNVTVADLLVFLCKEYSLAIDFTGNILSIKKHVPPVELPKERIVPISYAPDGNTISIDAKNDKLYDVFKRIMDESGKNLVFAPGMESKLVTSYIQDVPFDAAMDKLALANQMFVERTKDNFYVFEDNSPSMDTHGKQLSGKRKSHLDFKVLDMDRKLLEVDFTDTPIADIIHDIGSELDIDIFTATPLDQAGTVTFKTRSISFDELLTKAFESSAISNLGTSAIATENNSAAGRNAPSPNAGNIQAANTASFTFKKEGDTYFFGTENQLSVRAVEIIHLQHRSVELLTDPSGGGSSNRMGSRAYGNQNAYGGSGYNNNYTNQFDTSLGTNRANREPVNTGNRSTFSDSSTKAEALLSVLPDDIKQDLDIKMDYELNSFYVLGTSEKIARFKAFIKKIDRPVPVILIEVMLIEVNRNSTIETGVTWGIGDEPAETKGGIYPQTDLTLGARTINRVLNGFDGFGHINLGKVVPNFFATIKAMESNGNIKIRSTPKLSTLNGHRATFSNGQTSYYAVTQRNIYGTDNPQTSEITNYEPIDAELGLTIKPMVSGDGQVTLDIFVVQSSFGLRIAEDAPPDLNSREFSSIIRVQDQDIVVLGGLEEQVKNDSGTGVPFLARIPVIKWLFSSRKREDSKSKLTVLIKPTVIY